MKTINDDQKQLPLIKHAAHYGYNPQCYLAEDEFGISYYGKVISSNKLEIDLEIIIKKIDYEKLNKHNKLQAQNLLQQIQVQKQIDSNYITKILDCISLENYLYIIQPYQQYTTLQNEIIEKKIHTELETRIIVSQIIEAFKILQQFQICHRNLKPDNILQYNEQYLLTDFLHCKNFEQSKFMSENIGHYIYQCPQMVLNAPYTQKCDIWSLGIIIFELLFGTLPFQFENHKQLQQFYEKNQQQVTINFPFDIQISEQLQTFIVSCLQISEKKRYDWNMIFQQDIFKQNEQIYKKSKIDIDKNIQNNIVKIQSQIKLSGQSIESLFKQVDQDNDEQTVTFQEFTSILRDFKQNISFLDQKKMFKHFDQDNSGKISLQEFKSEIFDKNYSQQQTKALGDYRVNYILVQLKNKLRYKKNQIIRTFKIKDEDNSQSLQIEEFENILKELDPTINSQESISIFKLVDKDQSGTISINEFLQIINQDDDKQKQEEKKIKEQKVFKFSQQINAQLQEIIHFMNKHELSFVQLISQYDQSFDNEISLKEFQYMMKCINYQSSNSIIMEIFQIFDKDCSGKISIKEFEALLN